MAKQRAQRQNEQQKQGKQQRHGSVDKKLQGPNRPSTN
ncbi:hypothetical protein HNQ41_001783 [Texcoconibacillus texcoconensis]|uniref:Uncharacterized protein n=1 Tax=Texcoconibacillus texcoconensis TaxID=1095777 RepID=A0A840QQE5_9BACI|nr:spore protein [Texcoconibacillus texcoconensis]MBB5173594.1 hypothetical protein [Texcoconibacillus texcoconensis]